MSDKENPKVEDFHQEYVENSIELVEESTTTTKRKKSISFKNKALEENNTNCTSNGGKVNYQPADRPCPLCNQPRINHKNRDIAEDKKKGYHRGKFP